MDTALKRPQLPSSHRTIHRHIPGGKHNTTGNYTGNYTANFIGQPLVQYTRQHVGKRCDEVWLLAVRNGNGRRKFYGRRDEQLLRSHLLLYRRSVCYCAQPSIGSKVAKTPIGDRTARVHPRKEV